MGINELLLIASVFVIYGSVLLFYRFFGEAGLFAFTVFATITANIEVLILVEAFGMEMTLGNILFASTFLVTDILSETRGKATAKKAVYLGIAVSVVFILISQSWLFYLPAVSDFISSSIREVFSHTPRMMISGLLVYLIVQLFDVWVYHRWWDFTTKRFGEKDRFLWLRNNAATLMSQLINAVLFNLAAFWGTYDGKTLMYIILSTFIIYVFTTVADTPFVYLARKIDREKRMPV